MKISIYIFISYKKIILLWPNFKSFGSTMSCGLCDSTTPFLACLRSISYVFLCGFCHEHIDQDLGSVPAFDLGAIHILPKQNSGWMGTTKLLRGCSLIKLGNFKNFLCLATCRSIVKNINQLRGRYFKMMVNPSAQ